MPEIKCPCGKPVKAMRLEVLSNGVDKNGMQCWKPGNRVQLLHNHLPYLPFMGPVDFERLPESEKQCVVDKKDILGMVDKQRR